MKIYGVDFTSAPDNRKPITCAEGKLNGRRLRIESVARLESFKAFEAFLTRKGPWLAALDFPFGQPRKLITNMAWPATWRAYVRHVDGLGKAEFESQITAYRRQQPERDKHHKRVVDKLAGGVSPMTLNYTPVGKMFFEGAPRLLKSGASIEPCQPTKDNRVLVEAYPKLVARKWTATHRRYKDDKLGLRSPERTARKIILEGIRSTRLLEFYRLTLELGADLADDCLEDISGDTLDAVLCAIQAAWAYRQRRKGYGIPADCDKLEGWIADPELLTA